MPKARAHALLGKTVYVADVHSSLVWKGKVQSKVKGSSKWMVAFEDNTAYGYDYNELYAARRQATQALVDIMAQSSSRDVDLT